MRTTVVTATTVLALAGAVLVAPTADAAGRGVTAMHTTKKHSVAIAHSLRPGVAHFRNTGSGPILVVRKKKAGAAALATALNSTSSSAERRATARFDLVNVMLPKSDAWIRLSRGTYYFADLLSKKFTVARFGTATVKGKRSNAAAPKARSVTVGSTGRVPASTVVAPRAAIRVVNHYKYLSYGWALPVKAAATAAQLRDLVTHPSQAKLNSAVGSDEDSLFSRPPLYYVGGRHTVTLSTKLKSGRYLIMGRHGVDTGSVRAGDLGLLTVR